MRSQPSPVLFRVIALDQNHLLWGLVREVVPLVLRIILDTERSTYSIRVDEPNRNQIVLRVEMAPVRYREWLVSNGMTDGPPDVDESNARFEETRGLWSEMTVHPGHAGVEGLVDMNAFLGSLVSGNGKGPLTCRMLLTTGPRIGLVLEALIPSPGSFGLRLWITWVRMLHLAVI